MFLHVCVILFTGGGGSASVHAGIPIPLARQTPPPCAVHAGRYGQQAGGMHRTGLQFLFFCQKSF